MNVPCPYSPESLGQRWACSAEKVRQMCRAGELNYFRLGKLIRIPANEVERVECQNTSLNGIAESESSPTETQPDEGFAAHLARQMKDSPRLALVSSGQRSQPRPRNG